MTIHPDHHVPITASSKASAPRIGGPLIALAIAVMLGVGIAAYGYNPPRMTANVEPTTTGQGQSAPAP